MTQKCPADVQSQNNLTLKRHGYAIMSEGVLGFDLSGPSCCLSIERQRTVLNVVFKLFTQERGGGLLVSFCHVQVIFAQLYHSFLTLTVKYVMSLWIFINSA